MDTDSLIVTENGFQRLECARHDLKLGHLKVEGVTTDLEILAKKAYRFGDKEVIKGIKKKARKTGDNSYSQEYFTTLNYGFRSGNLNSVQTYDVEVHTRHVVTNALVGQDGTVTPRELTLTQDDVWQIVKPESSARWSWWCDVNWLYGLPLAESWAEPKGHDPLWPWSPGDV